MTDTRPTDQPWYRWYIGMLKDGTYRFILPDDIAVAEQFIGKSGGAVFTHAGFLIFASDDHWWKWIDNKHKQECETVEDPVHYPHIDVPNIECEFSDKALKWLEEHDEELKEIGGKYYEYIPRH